MPALSLQSFANMRELRKYCTVLCFAVFAWLPGCLGIHCYQCSVQEGDLPCDIFVKAPMWRPFEVECPASPPHLCGKSITYHYDGSESSEVRGCAPAENAYGVPNPIGCGRDRDGGRIFCICDSNLCNGASRLSVGSSTTTLLYSLFFFLVLFTFRLN